MLALYRIFALLLLSRFFLRFILKNRLKKNKETAESIDEKLGIYKKQRPRGKLIWFHAASVGEVKSIIPLIKRIVKAEKCHVLISSCTLTSAKLLTEMSMKNTLHVYAPLDNSSVVQKFIEHWQPNLGVFVDSELWPNLISLAGKEMPLMLLNARLSDSSYAKWLWFPGVLRELLNSFVQIFPSSKSDLQKFRRFVHEDKLKYIGNLKNTVKPDFSEKSHAELKRKYNKKIVFLAASTHEDEESQIMKALARYSKDISFIIVPRHPYRAGAIQKMVSEHALSSVLRSEEKRNDANAEVYIVDTIGELDLFYSVADIAFVGGSLVKHGGQNIIEAAHHGSLILFGSHIHNFKDAVDEFMAKKAAIMLKDANELQSVVKDYLAGSAEYDSFKKNSKRIVTAESDYILDAMQDEIVRNLEK